MKRLVGDTAPANTSAKVEERPRRTGPSAQTVERGPIHELVEHEFSASWYLAAYPEVATKIGEGLFADGLDHYVRVGHAEQRSPNSEFDEKFYLEAYSDVADAVRSSRIACGFQHFLQHGRAENRLPKASLGLACTVDAIRANFVEGWAANMADPDEILEVEFYLGDQVHIGTVSADRPRKDLLSVLPNPNHGFLFQVPLVYADGVPRQIAVREARTRGMSLREGRTGRRITGISYSYRHDQGLSTALLATDRLDEIQARLEELRGELEFVKRLASFPIADYDYYYRHFYELSVAELRTVRDSSSRLARKPRFSVILPTFESTAQYLHTAIQSVREQAYPFWELCISDDASLDEGVREIVRAHARSDSRIKFTFSTSHGGLAKNTNQALALSTGDYVTFLDHDDVLTSDALYVMALALQRREHDVLYSDEDLIDESGKYLRPHLKPDFNYDYCLAVNYLCHLLVIERGLMDRLGGLREGFDGCQDRDLVLRAIELCDRKRVRHVPRVLYHWRVNPTSVSNTRSNRDAILRRTAECVQSHFDRQKSAAVATAGDPDLFSCRVRWPLPTEQPLASIVIPSKDRLDLLGPCLTSILEKTDYENFEIVIVDHDSAEPATHAYLERVAKDHRVRVERFKGPFNWSALNNFGAARANGSILCFLNNDVLVSASTWLEELVSHAMRPTVGAVGAKLLYEDGTVQHAGIVLGIGGYAGPAFQRVLPTDAGYMGRAACAQEVSAVTGACLVCRRAVFDEVGGFDAAAFPIALNDVDFCLRLGKHGYSIIWTPHSVLYHFESKSRGYDDTTTEKKQRLASEASALRQRWGDALLRDACYNPHFDLAGPSYERLVIPKRIWTEADFATAEEQLDERSDASPLHGPKDLKLPQASARRSAASRP